MKEYVALEKRKNTQILKLGNKIESLTAQLEEAKENQRIAIEALEEIDNTIEYAEKGYIDMKNIAKQALSTIRGD